MKNLLKNYIRIQIDSRFNYLIENYLKTRFDLHHTPEYKNIFKKGYDTAVWEESAKMGKTKLTKVLDDNLLIYCYSDSILSKLIYVEDFEKNELFFVKRFLKEKDIFIDIGANIGLFSLIASKCVGKDGKVISFEPTPTTFQRLNENIVLNELNNVNTYQAAISNLTEEKEFLISKDGFDAWNSLANPTLGEKIESINVKCYQIDEIDFDINFNRANLVKIDIEGWELNALKGGVNYFSNPNAPTLLIEFTEQNAKNANTSCKELYKYIEKLGYKLFNFDINTLDLNPSKIKETYPYENLIATKNKSEVLNRIRSEKM